ncbi:hypothetical protein [Haloferula sargassicola]|uniref:Uncharacterized protein n=1 Tax=Haloferula sargassicola TaxID=490096 RepID=A0ABP9UMX2_9BACT
MPTPDSHTDPSERMKALFDAAIRSPDISATEKTMDLPPRAMAPVRPAPTVAESAIVPAPAVAPVPQMEVPAAESKPVVHHTEQDEELSAMLEERDGRLKKRRGRVRMVTNVALLALIVAPTAAVMIHPGLRAKFDWLVVNIGKSMEDVKSMANTKDSYDEALDKVATRGNQIDDATRALGVDPTQVVPGEDPEMKAEMQAFMGDEADGFDRRRAGLEKMGFVAKKLTGMEEHVPDADAGGH